jgi:hypothetical protein
MEWMVSIAVYLTDHKKIIATIPQGTQSLFASLMR